jgi:hypothetical protein
LELRTEGLAFSIMFTPPNNEGWMWCNAIINAPGFRGDLDFQMLRSDLDTFHVQLSNSLESANWPCEVRLSSTDPGIGLTFRVERTGQVVGTYEFGGRGAYRPVLSGAFAMDQTYLRPLLTQVEQLLADIAGR